MNRRLRNRTHGGVGGRGKQFPSYPILTKHIVVGDANFLLIRCSCQPLLSRNG